MLRGGGGTSRAPALMHWAAVVWGGEYLPGCKGEHLCLPTAAWLAANPGTGYLGGCAARADRAAL